MSIRVSGVAELLQCTRPDDPAEACIASARRAESIHGALEGHWGQDVLGLLGTHGADNDPDCVSAMLQLAQLNPDKQVDDPPEPQPTRVHNTAESQARRAEVRRQGAAWIRTSANVRGSETTTRALLRALYADPAASFHDEAGALSVGPAAPSADNARSATAAHEPFGEPATPAEAQPSDGDTGGPMVHADADDDDDEAAFGWYMPCEDDVRPMQLYPRGDDFAANAQLVTTELQPHFAAGSEGWACAAVDVRPEMATVSDPLQLHEWTPKAVLVPGRGSAESGGRPVVRVAPHPLVIPSVRRAPELKAAFGDVFERPNHRCSYAAELRRVWDASIDDAAGSAATASSSKAEAAAAEPAVPMARVPPIRRSDWKHLGASVAPLLRAALFNRVVQPRASHNQRVDDIPLLGRRLLCTGPMRVRAFDILPAAASLVPTSEEKFTVAADDAYIELHPMRFVLRPAFLEPSVGALPLRVPKPAASASTADSSASSPLTNLAAAASGGTDDANDPMAGSISSTTAVADGVVRRSAAVVQRQGLPVMTRQATACDPVKQAEVMCGLQDVEMLEDEGIGTIPWLPGGVQADGRPAPWLSPTTPEIPADPAVRRSIQSAVALDTAAADVDAQAAAEWAKLRDAVITGVLNIRVKAVSIVADADVGHRANNTAGVVRIFDAVASVRRVSVSMQLDGRPVLGAVANTIAAVLRPTVRRLVEHHIAAGMVGTHRLS